MLFRLYAQPDVPIDPCASAAFSMRILSIDRFPEVVGGKERYVFELASLLKSHGHNVHQFTFRPSLGTYQGSDSEFWPEPLDTASRSPRHLLRVAAQRLYNLKARDMLGRLLDRHPVDIAHVHSIFHLSAAVIGELDRRRIPVVWTLHDYQPICPISILFTRDAVCEDCRGARFFNAVKNRCSHGDLAISMLNAGEAYLGRLLGVYDRVSAFIAPTRFVLDKFVEFGWDPSRLIHVPHFAPINRWSAEHPAARGPILFAGRLQPQKGVRVFLEALARLKLDEMQEIVIIGDGPERAALESLAQRLLPGRVQFTGYLEYGAIRDWYRRCVFAVVPSVWHEVLGLAILEPYAIGRPVIGSRMGGIPEVIEDGVTGLLVDPGDPAALADAIDRMLTRPADVARMGMAARVRAETVFNPEAHYNSLLAIYRGALGI